MNNSVLSYASNLKALHPMKLVLSGMKEKLSTQLDKIDGVKNWKRV